MTATEHRHTDQLNAATVEREALDRIARTNIDRFAEIRTAAANTNVLDIALDEIIYRAHLDRTDRSDLVETLKNYPYTFGWHTTDTPVPEYVRGSWDQVPAMYNLGFLTLEELEAITAHVDPPA